MTNSSALAEVRAGKYLTFQLGGENYAIEILKVQEIIGLMRVTRVPNLPHYMRGVINLRGRVIPVIDLRQKFKIGEAPDTDRTCIIVVRISSNASEVIIGLIVDEVSEVQDIKEEALEPPPSFGTTVATEFLLGLGKIGQRVVMLLNLEKVITSQELAMEQQDAIQS